MRLFITLSRRSLAVILALVIILLIITAQIFSQKSSSIDGSTNSIRVEYLNSLKLYVDDASVLSKDIIIPESFTEVYKNYNKLQKKSGFDLSEYKGKKATVYTYKLNEINNVNIIVCNGQIIGGDISNIKLNGEMKPLK